MNIPFNLDNKDNRIKIILRKTKTEAYSIYLEYQIMINGKRYREVKSLGKKVFLKKNTKQADKLAIEEAKRIRLHVQEMTKDKKTGVLQVLNYKQGLITLSNYAQRIISNYKGHTLKSWVFAQKHCDKFFGKNFLLQNLDRDICLKYALYLKSQLQPNTANLYLQKFKQIVHLALEDNLIDYDPTQKVSIKRVKSEQDFLTIDEIKIIELLPINDINIKNAFLFSCYTGLRFGDLLLLKFSDIKNNILNKVLQKTRHTSAVRVKFPLPEQAKEIIIAQKKINPNNNFVFVFTKHNINDLPWLEFYKKSYDSASRKWERFFKSSGINKNIHFHSARHTFASICQKLDLDVYTIKNLLGHTDIKTTQKYLKDLEEVNSEAIDKISSLK